MTKMHDEYLELSRQEEVDRLEADRISCQKPTMRLSEEREREIKDWLHRTTGSIGKAGLKELYSELDAVRGDLERTVKERDEAIKKLACVEFTDWEKVSELNKKLQSSYRCFHCGEYFSGEAAAEHFGPKGSVVACVLRERDEARAAVEHCKARLAEQDDKAGVVFEDFREEIRGLKAELAKLKGEQDA